MSSKNFKLKPEQITSLVSEMGYCFATDFITVDGMSVGYMYREASDDLSDSGMT